MKEYIVVWEIAIDADSPTDAARRALEIQRDPESEATNFDVTGPDGQTISIDILEEGN